MPSDTPLNASGENDSSGVDEEMAAKHADRLDDMMLENLKLAGQKYPPVKVPPTAAELADKLQAIVSTRPITSYPLDPRFRKSAPPKQSNC